MPWIEIPKGEITIGFLLDGAVEMLGSTFLNSAYFICK